MRVGYETSFAVDHSARGIFAILFFFMISVQIAWWLILVGCEVTANLELGEEGKVELDAAPAEAAAERPKIDPAAWVREERDRWP